MRALDLAGRKFGRLTAIEKVGKQNGHITWRCKCDCGNEAVVQGTALKNGYTQSCGCLWKEAVSEYRHGDRRRKAVGKAHTTHGMSNKRIYRIWQAMRNRCGNPNKPDYKYYGGRGISVCEEWKNSFEPFYKWAMSNGYNDTLTIDRIDVNGNYEPNNCRWVTMAEQNKNKR